MPHIRGIRNIDRQQQMVAQYRAGLTLQQIGTRYRITRERVRQILKHAGMTRLDGGIHACATARRNTSEKNKSTLRDKRFLRTFGCTYSDFIELNGVAHKRNGTFARSYIEQRRNAGVRGIEWLITFPEWVRVWIDSGKLGQRGRGHGHYVMSRVADLGAYQIGNVFIQQADENCREAILRTHARFRAEGKYLGGSGGGIGPAFGSGRGWTLHKRSTRRPYQVTCGGKYVGCFATQEEAVLAYKKACAMKSVARIPRGNPEQKAA